MMILSMKDLFATLSINDTQHNSANAIILSVIVLNVAFFIVTVSAIMLSVVLPLL